MDKPFSVLCEEFRQELTDLINNSGLPPFVIESVLKNYMNEVSTFARNQYHIDKAKYECFLSEKEKREEEMNNEKK
jgi:hypothetical protein